MTHVRSPDATRKWMSAAGAFPPYRSEWEGQQRVEYDAFIKPSGSARSLRIAVVRRVIDVRPLSANVGPTHTMNHAMPGSR